MDKSHLGGGGGGLLALDASPRPLGFLNLLSPAPFHRTMEADDGGGSGGGRGRRSVEVDFFSDEKKNMKKSRVSVDAEEQKSQADGLAIKKEDLTINLLPGNNNNNARSDRSMVVDDDAASRRRHEEGKNTSELAAMQAELSRMNEENQRLRGMLTQVTNSYQALQMHLVALMQQRSQLPPTQPQQPPSHEDGKTEQGAMVPRQFLGLGPSGAGADVAEEPSNSSTEVGSPRRSSSNGNEDPERGDNPDGPSTAGWLPGRAMSQQLGAAAKGHDQQAQEATMRKARVSVRARSEAPIIADGCQWRKYGQKMAKGNPCPRAYYRCTMATGCPVRKQVQRCAEDRTILITTYEGTHNHPLPPAAMAMASTTSAAASMLLSGSMPSADGSGLMSSSNFLARTVLPCSSSMATISASAPFPTVTLDLTHGPHGPPNAIPLNAARPPAPGQFQIPLPGGGMAPAFAMPPHMLYNQSKFSGLQMSSDSVDAAAQFAQPRQPMGLPGQISDTVSAAAAAITADPNFTVALAAAITSIIGGQHAAAAGNNSNANNNNVTTSNNTTSNNTNSETQ
uniref:Uncharacterized protein n=1 Tax=Avena sativa TaxID=4498 RepID=A0ACD5VSM6_AVESA